MKTNPIPLTTHSKGHVYVRARLNGKNASAPFCNQWLKDRKKKPIADPIKRAEAIHRLLKEELQKESNAGIASGKNPSLRDDAEAYLAHLEKLPSHQRPIKKQRKRVASVLLKGTKKRLPFVQLIGPGKQIKRVGVPNLDAFVEELARSDYQQESIRSGEREEDVSILTCLRTLLVLLYSADRIVGAVAHTGCLPPG